MSLDSGYWYNQNVKTADELTALFRTRGLRVTPQRHALFRLLQGDDSHPTVQGLCQEARAEMRYDLKLWIVGPFEGAAYLPA